MDDIIWGCVQQTLEQGFNIAKNAALLTDIPHTVPAVTVNRLCGSSMQAIHDASRLIMTGDAKSVLIGGVEHMGHVPMTHGIDFNPKLTLRVAKAAGAMGLTAEMLAKMYKISREEQDAFALRSHQLAALATEKGSSITRSFQLMAMMPQVTSISVNYDEVIRFDASLQGLAALRPAFDPVSGTVTAGNSSALSDGASAMLLTSESYATQQGIKPRAKIRAMAVVGCDPSIMGFGPVPASELALKRAGLTLNDIDIIELNEALRHNLLHV